MAHFFKKVWIPIQIVVVQISTQEQQTAAGVGVSFKRDFKFEIRIFKKKR